MQLLNSCFKEAFFQSFFQNHYEVSVIVDVFCVFLQEILLFTAEIYKLKTVLSQSISGKCHNEM